jgi:hypothetical protein
MQRRDLGAPCRRSQREGDRGREEGVARQHHRVKAVAAAQPAGGRLAAPGVRVPRRVVA